MCDNLHGNYFDYTGEMTHTGYIEVCAASWQLVYTDTFGLQVYTRNFCVRESCFVCHTRYESTSTFLLEVWPVLVEEPTQARLSCCNSFSAWAITLSL